MPRYETQWGLAYNDGDAGLRVFGRTYRSEEEAREAMPVKQIMFPKSHPLRVVSRTVTYGDWSDA